MLNKGELERDGNNYEFEGYQHGDIQPFLYLGGHAARG